MLKIFPKATVYYKQLQQSPKRVSVPFQDTAASYIQMYCISMYTFQTDDWVIPLKQYEESVVAIVASLADETARVLHFL